MASRTACTLVHSTYAWSSFYFEVAPRSAKKCFFSRTRQHFKTGVCNTVSGSHRFSKSHAVINFSIFVQGYFCWSLRTPANILYIYIVHMYILRSIYIIYTYIYFEVYTYAGNLFLCVWTLRRRGLSLIHI